MSEKKDKSMALKLDSWDWKSVQQAISRRQGFGPGLMPDGGGNLNGRVIAEICRGWMEMLDMANIKRGDQ